MVRIKIEAMSIEELLDDPLRNAIIRSILSRENVSALREIEADITCDESLKDTVCSQIEQRLNTLVRGKILTKEYIHSSIDGKWAGYRYSIYADSEELQEILKKKFPVEYALF